MLGNLFGGVTKDTFMHNRTVPANPNDIFYGPKCLFCWGPYDDIDHTSVRILPCNHIMGLSCLAELIDSANGDTCPTCRTPLFHRSPAIRIERYVADLSFRICLSVLSWIVWFNSWLRYLTSWMPNLGAMLPPPPDNQFNGEPPKILVCTLQVLLLLVNLDNIYYFTYKFAEYFTDLDTDMRATAGWAYFFGLIERIVRYHAGIPGNNTFQAEMCRAWVLAICAYLWRGQGKVRDPKDRFIVLMIVIGAVVANAAGFWVWACSEKLATYVVDSLLC
jgi:hypothetical protein